MALSLTLVLAAQVAGSEVLVLHGGQRVEVDEIVITGHRVYAYPPGSGLGVAYDIDDVDLEATEAANAEPDPAAPSVPPEPPEPPAPPAPPPAAASEPPPAPWYPGQGCQDLRRPLGDGELALLLRDEVEILAAADPASPVIALGARCDMLTLVRARGRWCVVSLSSGADRYITREACASADAARLSLPEHEAARRQVFTAVQQARRHARAMSERLYPSDRQRRRHDRHRAQLEDRYVLEVLHELAIAPALLPRLEAEAGRKGWE